MWRPHPGLLDLPQFELPDLQNRQLDLLSMTIGARADDRTLSVDLQVRLSELECEGLGFGEFVDLVRA